MEFRPRRIGYYCVVLIFFLTPIHFLVPCEVSGAVGGCAVVLTLLTLVLLLADAGKDRLRPPLFATIGVILHALLVH